MTRLRIQRTFGFLALAMGAATVSRTSLRAQPPQTAAAAQAGSLPVRLSDAEFWKLVEDISEPGGVFRMADNFVSNEADIGTIAATIKANGPHGGVYMGVGPEQNLTYIVAVRPKMAFIVDIRRQAVMHHLLYKAIFELSKDRADFISLLFAKPRPPGLDSSTGIQQIWNAFANVPADTAAERKNLARFNELLTKTHGFTFTSAESDAFDHVYYSFVEFGPQITTNGAARGGGGGFGGRGGGRGALNFIDLTLVTAPSGDYDSFLGTDEAFRFLKELEGKNLFVPTSGNFGGPKAIRAVGSYVKDHGGTVTAFYVSNVEQYLFMDGIAGIFYSNVGTLPIDAKTVFIRPNGLRLGGMALCPIGSFLRAAATGRVQSWNDAQACPQ